MSPITALSSEGSPVFHDRDCEAIARAQGNDAAWRRLLEAPDIPAALSKVGGEFWICARWGDGRALLAVDRFSTRPLCWRLTNGELRYSSSATELAAPSESMDPQALFNYFFFHVIPAPRTIFASIKRLEAAHCLLFERGQVQVLPYWTPSFAPRPAGSFEERRDEFMGALEHAVARRLDGGTPACYLSGGTDSSTIAGMIGRVSGSPAHAYSIGFDAAGYDEMEFARLAARHFGCVHRTYYVTPNDLVQAIPQVAGHADQPFGNSSILPAYFCAVRAREDGVRRLLAGDGGDELFGGNARYATQKLLGHYDRLPSAARRWVVEPLLERTPLGDVPGGRKLRSYVQQAKVPMPDRMQMYNLLLRLGARDVFEGDFMAAIDADEPLHLQRTVWAATQAQGDLDRTLAFDWRFTLADCDLPKVCLSSSLAGVSVAFPMLDDELLAIALSMPERDKLRGLKLRWFFKEALRGFLPDATIAKRKQGFGLPFGVWLTQHRDLSRLAGDSLSSLSRRGVVRPAFIRHLLDHRLAQHPGYYGEMVWILMMLEQWLQRHQPSWRL